MRSRLRRAILFALPLVILTGYALWAFWPSRTLLAGIGDDPPFNAWNFLYLFRSFDKLGPLSIFSRQLWNAPIYAPGDLHLALSENQLWPALLMWPIWKATGGLVLTLGIGLFALHFAAFAAAAGWLGARGVREMRFFGGLVFALCGWMQSHYAHWQNSCIFVLPLALWSWERFRQSNQRSQIASTASLAESQRGAQARARAWLQLVLCALAFGSISGWNLYFSMMANLTFGALCLHAFRKHDVPRLRVIALAVLALLVQAPILVRYAELAAQVGQFAAWDSYPATAWSWLGRYARPGFLEASFGFWPRAQTASIEAVGFVGIAWLLLSLTSVIKARARWPLLGAAIFYWISLGPQHGHGLFDLLTLLPAFGALRAQGRFQIAVMVATLPAVFALLEDWRGVRRFLPLGLVLLELWPAHPAERVLIPQEIDGPLTQLELALMASPLPDSPDFPNSAGSPGAPLLVLDDVTPLLQLSVLRSGAAIFEGYTGRPTPTGDLLYEFAVRRRAPVADLLDLTQATRVLAVDGWRMIEARQSPRLHQRGCYPALGREVCLFDVVKGPHLASPGEPDPSDPRVSFGRDTLVRIVQTPLGIETRLVTTHAGWLDFAGLNQCHLSRVDSWPWFTRKSDLLLEGHSFNGLHYSVSGVVYRKTIGAAFLSWPHWLQPTLSLQIACR